MTDPVPDHSNRIAYALGYIFHPFVLFVPAALLVLEGEPLLTATGWLVLMGIMVVAPTAAAIYVLRTRERYIYRRHERLPVYTVAWVSMLACGGVLVLLDAPTRLLACMGAMAIWVPLQGTINEMYTKISGHAAFSMGVVVGLWILGELDTWWLQGGAIAIILLTAWARYVTKNHTLQQIVLGWGVAVLSVGGSFALML